MDDVIVEWTDKARADMQAVSRFYRKWTDSANARHRTQQIVQDVDKIAANSTLGKFQPGVAGPYQYWYALGTRYRVYFRRSGENRIRVVRVWSTKRRALKPSEIYEN